LTEKKLKKKNAPGFYTWVQVNQIQILLCKISPNCEHLSKLAISRLVNA
jgi:hypothetical protein